MGFDCKECLLEKSFKSCTSLQEILSLAQTFTRWNSAYVPPLETWCKNNVTLIGDAAHGTLPYLAQGAAMALEDAATFSLCLRQSTDIGQCFKTFFDLRHARTARLHRSSLATGKIYHFGIPAALLRNAVLSSLPAQLSQARLDWVYAWNGSDRQ